MNSKFGIWIIQDSRVTVRQNYYQARSHAYVSRGVSCVYRCVSVRLDHVLNSAETDEPIEVPFGLKTHVGQGTVC